MPKNQRPPTTQIVDISLVIEIKQVGPLTSIDNKGLSTYRPPRPNRRIDPSRKQSLRLMKAS
jgi:hypothetical protein